MVRTTAATDNRLTRRSRAVVSAVLSLLLWSTSVLAIGCDNANLHRLHPGDERVLLKSGVPGDPLDDLHCTTEAAWRTIALSHSGGNDHDRPQPDAGPSPWFATLGSTAVVADSVTPDSAPPIGRQKPLYLLYHRLLIPLSFS